eukprot:1915282-Alexandrium_andersonii.AAC.1
MRPSLAERAAHHGMRLTHLARARNDDVSSRAQTTPQPDSGPPPGVEAAVYVRRPNAVECALAELVAVITARLAPRPLERRTPVMSDE